MQNIVLKDQKQNYRLKEAFKTLRTNIEFSGDDVKVVCFTSPTPNEGKSTITFNIAKSFAQEGKKCLLIDADLRKSVMRSRHEEGILKYGLTNYLVGKNSVEDCMCQTNINKLYMIFAGPVPPNPSELLGHKRFQALVEAARNAFDIVIIDCPPLGSVIDAAVIAKQCDGSVLIIESGLISRQFAHRVKEQLEVSGCRVLGCVLNKVKMTGNKYFGKYYGKYYGQYYGQDEDEMT